MQINTAKTSLGVAAPGIDFSLLPGEKLRIPSGETTFVDINLDETLPLRVVGKATLTIDSFVSSPRSSRSSRASHGTSRSTTARSGTSTSSRSGSARASRSSARTARTGSSRPTATSSRPRAPGAALGIAVSELELGIALLKPTTALHKAESYYAISGSGDIEVIGLDALTLTVRNLEIQVNGSNVPNRVVNFVHTNSYGAGGLEIPTGGDPVFIKFSTQLLRASADITLSISQFVYISGKFAFEKGAPLTLMPRTGGQAPVDLSVIKVGATDVHAFVGIGGPYWVTDPDGTVHAPVGTSSAIGLKLSEVEFGLALMKPVTGPAVSYYALTATIGEIALLSPFPGFELSATTLNIRVNGSNAADKHVINLSTRTISVPTSGTTSVTIGGTAEWGTALLEAEGNIHVEVFELSLDAHIYFRMTTRQNGTRVILLAISGLSFVVGDPLDPIFELSGIHGALYLADAGFAGELTLPTLSFSAGNATTGMNFTATASIAINTTGARVQETFNTATGTETLDLDAGEYIRILVEGLALNVTVAGVSATLRGNFQFEQITLPVISKVVRIAATESRWASRRATQAGACEQQRHRRDAHQRPRCADPLQRRDRRRLPGHVQRAVPRRQPRGQRDDADREHARPTARRQRQPDHHRQRDARDRECSRPDLQALLHAGERQLRGLPDAKR